MFSLNNIELFYLQSRILRIWDTFPTLPSLVVGAGNCPITGCTSGTQVLGISSFALKKLALGLIRPDLIDQPL